MAAIRIMSSNIWGNCKPHIPISNRDDLLSVLYRRYLPDAIGIQECSPKLRAEAVNLFALCQPEYRELDVDFAPNANNYTPILYRPDRVTPADCGYFSFAGPNDGQSKSVTWAVFDTAENARFILVNTHYYYTSDDIGRAARVSNSYEMLALMTRLEQQYPDTPFVLTGDFNCATADAPLQLLLANGIRESRDAVDNPPTVCSYHGYPEVDGDGQFRRPSSVEPGAERSIDHILYRGKVQPRTHVVVIDREALIGTDHSPIYVDFAL